MMFSMWNRKPQSRFQKMGNMASRRWNRMMGRDVTGWQQAGQVIKSRPWIGILAATLLFAGLAFTFGRRIWSEIQI
jgi:hypothetical protein